jgi:hypothetical protein
VSKRVIVVTRRKAHTHRSLIASVALVVAIALAALGVDVCKQWRCSWRHGPCERNRLGGSSERRQ